MKRDDILQREQEIRQWIAEQQPFIYMCQQLDCRYDTLHRALSKLNIEYHGQQNKKGQAKLPKIPASYYFDNTHPITTYKLRIKLLDEGYKDYVCECCGLREWNGKQIPLELHHIDGNRFNNALENLQMLCPNCHAQTETYRGNNIGNYN